MIAYTHGIYDILRAKDLQDLDKQIQLSSQDGASYFGVGIYDANLCEHIGLSTPLKSLEDRMKMDIEYIKNENFINDIKYLLMTVLKIFKKDEGAI